MVFAAWVMMELNISVAASLAESRRQAGAFFGRALAESSAELEAAAKALRQAVQAPLNLLLYLCSDTAEYADDSRTQNPQPIKTKKGMRTYPADMPTYWHMGVRIGAAIRAAQEQHRLSDGQVAAGEGRASPIPHMRRAHWHSYRVGQGRVDMRLNWLNPISVNAPDQDAMPSVLHKVS